MVYSRQGNFSDFNCGFGSRGGVFSSSQTEYLLELAHGVHGVLDRVSDDPGVLIEVVVVAPDIGLVAEKVDLVETLDVVEAVALVPTLGVSVNRDLPANGKCQSKIWELGLQSLDEFAAYVLLLVELVECLSLFLADAPANGTDVDQAVPELDEVASFEGEGQLGHVAQAKVDELLDLFLANEGSYRFLP